MIIGLHGKKLSGKDTIGAYLVENYEFRRIGFADKLKEAVANLFDIDLINVDKWKYQESEIPFVEVKIDIGGDVEYTYTWREFLQRFGTEMGRNTFGEGFWVDMALPRDALVLPDFQGDIVVTDVRFENEARRILALGGYMIEVSRPSTVDDEHISEAPLPSDLIDGWIENNGTIQDLHKDVDQLMEDINDGKVDRFRLSGGD